MKGQYLENLNWKQAEEALKDGPFLVLPLGARLKEHGLHLPLNNDWLIAEYFAKRIAENFHCLVAPTAQYGYYPAFVNYPGSINIQKDTFIDYLKDICLSLTQFGCKKIYIMNTGISTLYALEPLRLQLQENGVLMDYFSFESIAEFEEEIAEQEEGSHADEIETSMMLYIAPDKVNMSLAQKDIPTGKGRLTPYKDDDGRYCPTGVYGDPTLATKEKGQLIVEKIEETLQHFLKEFESPVFQARKPLDKYL